jgi:hypothetical protein
VLITTLAKLPHRPPGILWQRLKRTTHMDTERSISGPRYSVYGHFRAPIDDLRFQQISGDADVEFREDNGFPERVIVYPSASIADDPISMKAHVDELAKLMQYGATTDIHIFPRANGSSESYVMRVADVHTDGVAVLAVQMPTYVPIHPVRHIVGSAGHRLFRDEVFNITGASYIPVHHLTLPAELELEANITFRKFDRSDLMELVRHVPLERDNLGHGAFLGGDIIMLHLEHQDISIMGDARRHDLVRRIHRALMLFKPGVVTFGNIISIQSNGLGNGIDFYQFSETRPRLTNPQYNISADEVPLLAEWWREYSNSLTESDCPIARAETRLLRSTQGDQSDRLTDAIIGLETLMMSGQKDELRYRIGLRVAHLLVGSHEPLKRIELRRQVKKLYDQRSGVVHESESKLKDAENLANQAREILRSCIRAILLLPEPLRAAFCSRRKNRTAEDDFFELLVATGNVPDAFSAWQSTHST